MNPGQKRDPMIDFLAVCVTFASLFCFVAWEDAAPKEVKAIVYSQVSCAPCQRMKKELKAAGISVDFEERESELDRMKIKSTPTTIIFVNRRPAWTHVGYISPKDFQAKLDGFR